MIILIETVLFMLGARAVGAVLLGLMNSCAELFPSVMAISLAYIVSCSTDGRLFVCRRKTVHISKMDVVLGLWNTSCLTE